MHGGKQAAANQELSSGFRIQKLHALLQTVDALIEAFGGELAPCDLRGDRRGHHGLLAPGQQIVDAVDADKKVGVLTVGASGDK